MAHPLCEPTLKLLPRPPAKILSHFSKQLTFLASGKGYRSVLILIPPFSNERRLTSFPLPFSPIIVHDTVSEHFPCFLFPEPADELEGYRHVPWWPFFIFKYIISFTVSPLHRPGQNRSVMR